MMNSGETVRFQQKFAWENQGGKHGSQQQDYQHY